MRLNSLSMIAFVFTCKGLPGAPDAGHELTVDKLHQEVRGAKIKRKADRATIVLRKVVECSWWRLRDTD